MGDIAWDEKFRIDVEAIDEAHAKLFRIIKKLRDISENPETKQLTYKEGIKYLEAYSMTHFLEEETYMRSIRYKGYAQHKKLHDNFRDKTLVAFKKEMEATGYSKATVCRFLEVMNHWLAEHIMREDQAIVGKAIAKKNYDVSSQLSVISKVVNRTMTEVFQTEAKLATADYKGQNIGDGFYCYRLYDTEEGIRIQLLLGADEALIIRGINRIPGVHKIEKGNVPAEEVLPVFERISQNMSKMFRIETEYELGKENLLTRDEFRKDFMKRYPCRLLFNVKNGYFIFCYRGWRLKNEQR